MSQEIYRVLKDDEVIAIFNNKKYANDFVDYESTIANDNLEIEPISLANWLLEPREF